MTTATTSTQWPAIVIAPDIKELVALLFSLVESKESTVGDQLANDVFTADGKFLTPHSTASGSAEITRCRDNVWGTVASRQHSITKVYASDSEGLDLFLLGDIKSETNDGTKTAVDFVARLVFERKLLQTGASPSSIVRVKLYQAAGFAGGK